MKTTKTLAALAFASLSITAVSSDLHVSPNGSDTNPGTNDKPFATLARAREAVRAGLNTNAERDFTVFLHGGTYRLTEPFVLGLEDSPREGHTVTYAAAPGERPVLSGGVPITGWTRLENPPEALPEAARGKVWSAPLPPDIENANSLYDATGLLPRAMSRAIAPDPDREPARGVHGGWAEPTDEQRIRLGLLPGQVRDWSYVKQMELRILPRHEFCDLLPLSDYEQETHTLVTAVPCSVMLYPSKYKKVDFGHGPEPVTCFLENSPEFIDQPGEWSLDRKAGRILLWPRTEGAPEEIVLGNLTELVRIEGEVREEMPEDKPVRGIHLEGLTLAHTARLNKPANHRDWALQNAWDLYDSPTHAVRLRSAVDCLIRTCEFRQLGSGAVRMDLHSQRNQIRDSWIHDIGGTGILVQGYGLGTKDVNRENVIENNLIERIGRVEWDRLGIFIWQSGGNRIVRNHVRDTNYTGIGVSGEGPWEVQKRFWPLGKKHWRWNEIREVLKDKPYAAEFADLAARGLKPPQIGTADDGSLAVAVWWHGHFLHSRDNLIARNRVENVSRICGDANAIYIGGGAGRGNRVEENYCDQAPESIRCDDDVRGTLVLGNVIGQNAAPLVIKGGNHFERNIVLAGGPSRLIRASPSHPNCMFGTLHFGEAVIRFNILAQSAGALSEDILLASDLDIAVLKKTPELVIAHNGIWAPGDPAKAEAQIAKFAAWGRPDALIFGDPQFRDPDRLDFRTGKSSPLRAVGIEGVDLSDGVGLRSDFPFAKTQLE